MNIEALINLVFQETPLEFIRDFLRHKKRGSSAIRIGVTATEVRNNLRTAVTTGAIHPEDLDQWLRAMEGWGKQHLYIERVPRRALTHAHLLSTAALSSFLDRQFGSSADSHHSTDENRLASWEVDDERATFTWRASSIDYERHEELDRIETIENSEYQFRAYRILPRTSASRLVIRKTDGVILKLLHMPLGDEHNAALGLINGFASRIVAPLPLSPVPIEPMMRSLDQTAMSASGEQRRLQLAVSPTQARWGTDGARVEFKSKSSSKGYIESYPARTVRNALQVAHFLGEAGKFQLQFASSESKNRSMIVSFDVEGGRLYLFSRMEEREVLRLVDHLMSLSESAHR